MRDKTTRAVAAASIVVLAPAPRRPLRRRPDVRRPDKVCGVPVKESALSPLLPEGEKARA